MSDDGWVSSAFAHLLGEPKEDVDEATPEEGEGFDGSSDPRRCGVSGGAAQGAADQDGVAAAADGPEAVRARVLEIVASIPVGRAMTYGDIGAVVGAGPRQVGRVMATNETEVPWWRVTNASGALPDDLASRAAAEYRREGTPLRGIRVDLRAARWRPE